MTHTVYYKPVEVFSLHKLQTSESSQLRAGDSPEASDFWPHFYHDFFLRTKLLQPANTVFLCGQRCTTEILRTVPQMTRNLRPG